METMRGHEILHRPPRDILQQIGREAANFHHRHGGCDVAVSGQPREFLNDIRFDGDVVRRAIRRHGHIPGSATL